MYKKLLKNMILALFLTAAVPTLNAQIAHIGDILCEGDLIVSPANYPSSGATAKAVVFYVDNTGQHGWAIALQDAGSFAWGNNYSDSPLSNYTNNRQAIYDLDGYTNTFIVRQYNSSNFPAFYAVDFENGWYLPAIGQLNYLYGNLVEVNNGLQKAGGTPFEMDGEWFYWSSTEYSQYTAWSLKSSGELFKSQNLGNNGWYGDKGTRRRVRGVCAF